MSRLMAENGFQKYFLSKVRKEKKLNWRQIANICNVCDRTVRDWYREKFKMRYEAAVALSKKTKTQMPEVITILPEYWSTNKAAIKGGLARYKKYGNPGTPEGRKKGGLISQRKFRLDPEYAKKIGIRVRKEIAYPYNSELLAEFIGILLGDGGVTKYQVIISFNRVTEKAYSDFIQYIATKLFKITSTITSQPYSNGGNIVISSVNLVNFLLRKGLKIGSKIRNKVDIPKWILKKDSYKIACIRGLVDTDGSFYLYKHKVNNKTYNNFAMCFSNHSLPLLRSSYKILKFLGFNPILSKDCFYMHKKNELERYFKKISTNNPNHLLKFKRWQYDQ